MGTDYYLADPAKREVRYIDRSGVYFAHQAFDREVHLLWPFGPVRVIRGADLDPILTSLEEDEQIDGYRDERTRAAVAWCRDRSVVVLVDDHSPADEAGALFCHQVVHGGWVGRE